MLNQQLRQQLEIGNVQLETIAHSRSPIDPAKLDRHFERKYGAEAYLAELSGLFETLQQTSLPVQKATISQLRKKLDDKSTECRLDDEGEFFQLALVEEPSGRIYYMLYLTPLNAF